MGLIQNESEVCWYVWQEARDEEGVAKGGGEEGER